MKALVLNSGEGFSLYKKGEYPEHLLYGVAELERMGYQVCHLDSNKDRTNIFKIFTLIVREKPDLLFIPYISKKHMIFGLLKRLFFKKMQLCGWIHQSLCPKVNNKFLSAVLQLYILWTSKGFDNIYFLSPKTLTEAKERFELDNLRFTPWSGDMDYYDKYYSESVQDYFISTGKENRNIELLAAAAEESECKLKIFIKIYLIRVKRKEEMSWKK